MIQRYLEDKRLGREHSAAQVRAFIDGVLDGTVTRAQAAAWLAFVCCRGMTRAETVALTLAMTETGDRMRWDGLDGPFIDKHSTGGVGDKVSLVLAPVWVALGFKVPMISGRGLGITGGTLDKLEAIPGYRTSIDPEDLRVQLRDIGCFIVGQTEHLAPADRFLYALRDETSTVPSVPLITASILSKKLAEGLDRLVLDVKCGSGAFMKTREDAALLADSLVSVGQGAGLHTEAHITDMNQPLGDAVGNALEVTESLDCLRGGGPEDLRELVVKLSGQGAAAERVLASGEAYEIFCRMARAQGGDAESPLLGGGCAVLEMRAEQSGRVVQNEAEAVGRAAFALGAGRVKAGDPVHFGVGVMVRTRVGRFVQRGDVLFEVHHHGGRGLAEAITLLRSGLKIIEEGA